MQEKMFIEAFYDNKEFNIEEKSSGGEELDFPSFQESRQELSPS